MNPKITHYRLITGDIEQLEAGVRQMLRDGFQPLGGPAYVGTPHMIQAMVKLAEEPACCKNEALRTSWGVQNATQFKLGAGLGEVDAKWKKYMDDLTSGSQVGDALTEDPKAGYCVGGEQ